MPPLVTIVGRPNVGKSTLFNRLARSRRAIVDGSPGITRDRIYEDIELEGRTIRLADTGGLDLEDADAIVAGVRDQALEAVNEAEAILFVVDVRAGLMPADSELATHLRRYGKPLLLVLNKVDSAVQDHHALEFHKLGIEETVSISAEHNLGMQGLVDWILNHIPDATEISAEKKAGMKVAIIGRPNVGKSSLLNAILGEGRMIVNEKAGTTRDVIDVSVEIDGLHYTFLDTAGIRRKTAINARVEAVSSIKARKSIAAADCCILVLDAAEGLTSQDKALGGMIDREGKGAIIALNKWDLAPSEEEDGKKGDRLIRDIYNRFSSLSYAPIIATCALTGLHVPRLIENLKRIFEIHNRSIRNKELNLFKEAVQVNRPPPAHRGKAVRIMDISQTETAPARFKLVIRGVVPDHYLRFLENELRRTFDLEGVPIRFSIVHC